MKTLYQQFTMKPPSKMALAERLSGAKSRTTGVAVPVPVSQAPETFFRKANVARNQLVQTTYPLGAQGGLSGFGMLGNLSGDNVITGIDFNHVWSMEDFLGTTQRAKNWMNETSGGPRGLEFPPQDFGFRFYAAGSLNAARAAWSSLNELASSGNTAAVAAIREFTPTLQNATREVDATWDGVRFGIASRAPDLETRRHNALKTIARTLDAIIDREQVIKAAVEKQRAETGTSNAAAAQAGAAAQVAAQEAKKNVAAASTKAAAAATPFYANPIVLGVGGLVVVGGLAFVLLRKKG